MRFIFFLMLFALSAAPAPGAERFEKDIIKTSAEDLEITFIGHASLMMRFAGKVVHVDPWSKLADYVMLPKADPILITHQHPDHLDRQAIDAVRTKHTQMILNRAASETVPGGRIMQNGDVQILLGIRIEAVPAYNLVHLRENMQPFHPKGEGNGYVLTLGDKRLYIAGDTENTPEMKALRNIDIAFLPMNLPYTMTPEMVADAVRCFKPGVLYPYHYGRTKTLSLLELLKDSKDIELRILQLQ